MKNRLNYSKLRGGIAQWLSVIIGLVIMAATVYGFYKVASRTVCDQTLHYDIGTLDPQFNLAKDQFAATIDKAAHVWDDPMQKQLFQYTPGAPFKINLIYDSRQVAANSRTSESKTIDATTANYTKLKVQFDAANATYNKSLASYNQAVAVANSSGVVSQKEYDSLRTRSTSLITSQKNLQTLADQLNAMASKLNLNIDQFNAGSGQIFDQGIYDGKAINIYEFQSQPELELAVAHELGHALGLDHLSNPKDIMYYMLQAQDITNIKAQSDDLSALKTKCRLN